MQAHIIKDGRIANTIEVESLDTLPGFHLVDASVGGAIGDLWDGSKPVSPVIEGSALDGVKLELMASVDDAVAAVISKSTRFAIGYEQREAAAIVFRDAGYVGDPTIWVSRFAENTGMTNQAAADLILSQADHLRGKLQDLEALRMDKYKIQAAADEAAARTVCAAIIQQIKDVAATI